MWGREILAGDVPSFEGYRTPTQHPLWITLSAALSALGRVADRVLVAVAIFSFVTIVAAAYRLGRAAFSPLVGLVAALLALTRLDFSLLAANAFVDVPYVAMILWAAAFEAERPRRGGRVWLLLIGAGLLRPEGWAFAAAYAAWLSWRAPWRTRARALALAAAGPAAWALTDLAVTGDPLYSLSYTRKSSLELGYPRELRDLPVLFVKFVAGHIKWPALALGVVGLLIAARLARARLWLLVAVGAIGPLTLVAASLRELPVLPRYMAITSLVVTIFAAYALGGFERLPRGSPARGAWAAVSVVVVLAGAIWTIAHLHPRSVQAKLAENRSTRAQLEWLLSRPAVRTGRSCGPVSVPNHKLLPDVRWILDAGPAEVVARSDPRSAATARRGTAIFVAGPLLHSRAYTPFSEPSDSALIQVPGEGFRRVATTPYFSAYVNCGAG
ncbi:MAG: hypothetical protein M3N16_05575 [Actinomycetota bacterium]|nr:hypothetical protein [Actinomycetota bacterium]